MSTSHTIRAHAQKFEINWTKIKGGCQSGRKVVIHNSKSYLPLTGNCFYLISCKNTLTKLLDALFFSWFVKLKIKKMWKRR